MPDDVTADPSTGSTTASEAAADTALSSTDASSQPSESPSETTSQEGAATGQPGATTPPDAHGDPNSSLASETRSANPSAAKPSQAPDDYQKRYNDQLAYVNRLARETAELRKYRDSWGDLDPRQVRDMVQRQQQQAQVQQLKPWHPRHPEFARTEARIGKVEAYKSAREEILSDPELDPKTKQRLVGNIAQRHGVSQEDVELYREHQEHVQGAHQRFARDPDSFIADIVESRIQARLNEYDQFRSMHSQTEAWLNDPARASLLEKYSGPVLEAMDDRTPRREVGIKIAQLMAENEALKSKLGSSRETVETAAAQSAALRKKSTVTRDAATSPVTTDPVEEGLKEGLTGVALINHLRAKRAVT